MNQQEDNHIEKPMSKQKLKLLSLLFVCLFTFMFYVCGRVFFEEISNIDKIRNGHIYIGNRDLAFGSIFFFPILAVLDYMLVLVIMDRFKDHVMKLFIKIAIISIPVMIIASIIYSFWIGSQLRGHGYSHCTWYDSPTRGTPVIWVKSERYCQKRASLINYDLLIYFDKFDNEGKEPSNKELDLTVIEMLENNLFYQREHAL